MATLVSAGVSVTVSDESFFIPASSSSVPLIFVATIENKYQPNSLAALGTMEHDVVRTVTSTKESLELYGIPSFLEDYQGNAQHGDARNEYGLFALNQFLGVGNKAYVVRANVNLDDDITNLRAMWVSNTSSLASVLQVRAQQFIDEFNTANGFIPSSPGFKLTVNQSELISLVTEITAPLWDKYSFRNLEPDFMNDHTASPLSIYANGYDQPATGSGLTGFLGFGGMVLAWVAGGLGTVVPTEWTAQESSDTFLDARDDFKFTLEFKNLTSLGADDAARRVAITTAMSASINNPLGAFLEDVYDYNLILAPGYHEVVDDLAALAINIKEEAFVIADTPMNMSPSDVVVWADTNSERVHSNLVGYYYGHGLGSNLDGKTVACTASSMALRTFTYNDVVAFVWNAPAGTNRGVVTGVSSVGYVSGRLGSATLFIQAALNVGQRDNLYKYTTNINPITFIPGVGIVVMGQKTSAPAQSALDRVNVMRMLCYIRRQIRRGTTPFLFEPNDQATRDNVKAAIDGFLGNILIKRGLIDFVTISDESNNGPSAVDRSELYVDVAIKPEKAVEFIYVPIRVLTSGAELP